MKREPRRYLVTFEGQGEPQRLTAQEIQAALLDEGMYYAMASSYVQRLQRQGVIDIPGSLRATKEP